jgi:hypothetical protein
MLGFHFRVWLKLDILTLLLISGDTCLELEVDRTAVEKQVFYAPLKDLVYLPTAGRRFKVFLMDAALLA